MLILANDADSIFHKPENRLVNPRILDRSVGDNQEDSSRALIPSESNNLLNAGIHGRKHLRLQKRHQTVQRNSSNVTSIRNLRYLSNSDHIII